MNKEKLLKELERLTPSITMEMLESILDNFFNGETRAPITSETLTAIKRKTGVQLSVKNIQRQVDALVVLGCKLAPTAYERTTKKWMISDVCSKVAGF